MPASCRQRRWVSEVARTLWADVRGARDATEEVTCPQSLYPGLCESGYRHFLGWSGREWAGQPRRCGAEGRRSWWPVAPRAVGAALVVGPSPALDEDLGFPEGVEDLAVARLVAQLPVEALDLPDCPGAAGLNEEGLGPNAGPPPAHGPGGELRAVVRAEVGGTPGATMRSVRPWSMSAAWMCRATSMASHACVNSSSTVNRCSGRPSWDRAARRS